MEQRTIEILFTLLRCAICGTQLTEQQREQYAAAQPEEMLSIAAKHDVTHLLVLGLKSNNLITKENGKIENCILKAAYRYEKTEFALQNVKKALETVQIPFLPLKGAVMRKYYPQGWMRTSCDIDILVHNEDLEKAVSCLEGKLGYVQKDRTTHDVLLHSPEGANVELHFDLVEEGRANDAIEVLRGVWENAALQENSAFCYEMNDPFFYYYHIAHMAKHFENGGCGLRPFIDLWILDHMENADVSMRDALLAKGNLLAFTEACRALNQVWFDGKTPDMRSLQMQDFLLRGGLYGSADNRVAIQQEKQGGRLGYLLSRIFVPCEKLKRYYPVLEKHPYLMPAMQVRRWFMLLRPDVAKMAKMELAANESLTKANAEEMKAFLAQIGLD